MACNCDVHQVHIHSTAKPTLTSKFAIMPLQLVLPLDKFRLYSDAVSLQDSCYEESSLLSSASKR